MRILIVEDEMIAALYVQKLVENLGYEPMQIVSEGDKAIQVSKEEQPDIILMDINLKGDMDGIQAVQKIRQAVDAPVIYMTAYSNQEVIDRAKLTEPSAYLVKPFDATDLNVAIKLAVHKHKVDKKLAQSNKALRILTRKLQDIQEEERRRIAMEVHDVLGQNLIGLKLLLASFMREIDGQLSDKALKIRKDFDKAMDELVDNMHRIADGLRPVMLDRVGLVEAVKWEIKQFEKRSGLACSVDTALDDEVLNNILDKSMQTSVFRIIQESLTNIVKHAQATKIQLKMAENDSFFYLQIRDDGIGIADKDVDNHGHGLLDMKERAEHLGGTLTIHSDNGSVVEISLPLNVD